MKRKILSVVTTFMMLCSFLGIMPVMEVGAAQNRTANFSKSYTLGSNLSQNIVNVAYAQIGKTGADLNYTENWCADFVSDCAELAGFGSAVPRNANCTDLYNAIKKAGGTDIGKSQTQPGDIVFYDNNKSPNGIADHVEIVYSGTGESLLSIGGNTGSYYISSAKVCSPRNHPYLILHIVRPSGGAPIQNDDELGIPYPRPSGNPNLKNGSTGSGVSWLQTALNKANNAGLDVDGQFGSATQTAVTNFQKANGLEVDGIAGPATINKLVEVIKAQTNKSKPSWAWISATDDRTSFDVGEQIHFWFSADETCEPISGYTIGINKGGERILTESCGRDYYISFDEPGNYSVYVSAYNSVGWADSNTINFQVVTPIPKGHVMSENEAAGQTIPDGDYWIYSAINQNYALDIPGDGISSPGANIQTWIWDTEVMPTQYDVFTVTYCGNGFYEIRQKDTDLCFDVENASLERGTNVQLWPENNTSSQEWSIMRTDTGYMLQARCNGYCLDIYGGEFEKETNIRVWDQNNTLAQRFLFIPYGESYGQTIDDGVYSIRSAIDADYCIDVAGNAVNSNYKNETNVQLWETASCDDLFYVEYLSNGYYNISEISSGLSLDVYNSVSESVYMNVNTNIQLYEKHNGRSQSWLIKDNGDGTYAIISKLSGYCVDLRNGLCEKSQNIAQFIYNYAGAQKWKFIPVLPQEISVVSKPYKISYKVGESINSTGIAVQEIYDEETFRDITDKVTYSYDFSKVGETKVIVSYTLKGNTYKDTFSVAINGSGILGDCNSDEKLNISDAVLLQHYLSKKKMLTFVQSDAADMNGDGVVNVFDIIILKRKIIYEFQL